jgi:hypothetical protein
MTDRDLWLLAELIVIMQFDGTQKVDRLAITNITDMYFLEMMKNIKEVKNERCSC